MPGFDRRDFEHSAISLLATTFVVAGGIVLCAFMSVAFGREPIRPLLMSAAVFGATAWLLYLLRERPRRAEERRRGLLGVFRRHKVATIRYRPRKKAPHVRHVKFGTNQPPTPEELRDLADGLRTWVPSKAPDRSEPSDEPGGADRSDSWEAP
ncbi:MAG TPA: hypothetical protein EYP14_18925 [Planctomycetaceae bacterium]|nr:hypothetical protein [Planctomycetaceae bacterium]